MYKSEIIKEQTDKLLDGVEKLEEKFTTLTETTTALSALADGPDYFDRRADECNPLIQNCRIAVSQLPKMTPPTSKIQRNQYDGMINLLKGLQDKFETLQEKTNTVLNPATTPANKAIAIGEIVFEVPFIIKDFAFMKVESLRIKMVMRFGK
tara:strand:+ start:82 stop:537 length:456 start_codon:yes stop_codon:yes gene_type:complete